MAGDQISAEAYLFIEVRDRVYRYRIVQTVTPVGAAEDNVVRIKEASVAQHHLLITYVDGKFYLRRVEESPVRLNGEKFEGYSEELRHGDIIGMGEVRLRLAEGGKVSDTAVLITIYPHVEETTRPFQLFMTRKSEFSIGDAPADLWLPNCMGGNRLTVENLGSQCSYLVPPEKGGESVRLNEVEVPRRTRLKDRDVLRVRGFTMRLRFLRAEILDDPEGIIWPEVLRQYALPETRG